MQNRIATMNNERQPVRVSQHSEISRHRSLHRVVSPDSIGHHRPLLVMKFGGTSVADAACIRRAVDIVRTVSGKSDVVVVVSAMAGVTNRLLEAAVHSEAGDYHFAANILLEIGDRHRIAINSLVNWADARNHLAGAMQALLDESDRLCRGTMLLGELTPRVKDSISSLGERLSAPLVAAALADQGMPSKAIDATDVIVTDSYFGGASPLMVPTRQRCEASLRPLLQKGIIPVVTGFIGATEEGTLTTLGRGGSDYSATILAAALSANEVVIWTDVDGLQTADPRWVTGVHTIPEISYREAAELAYFGAKVLHPKTLRALMDCGIPVWIRNTFIPEQPGTRITKNGPSHGKSVGALTAINEAALITLSGPSIATAPDLLARVFARTSAVHADVLLISQSSAQNDICLAVLSSRAKDVVEALRHELAQELEQDDSEQVILDDTVAMVSVVAQSMSRTPGAIGRLFGALGRENINLIAIAQGPTDCKSSFVVARKDLQATLLTTHREFHMENSDQSPNPITSSTRPALWYYQEARSRAEAD